MKAELVLSIILQIGMGVLLIYVGNYRKHNIAKNKNKKYWKRA